MSLRSTAGLVALLVVAATGVPVAHAAVTDPTVGPLESGTSVYVDGVFAWTGYAYNDHGPNTSAGSPGSAAYPEPRDESNAANLIQLQVRIRGDGGLSITAVLETLTHADEPLLGMGLGTGAGGAVSVPGGTWRVAGPLGLEWFVTASSDGGRLLHWADGAWRVAGHPHVVVSTSDQTMRVDLPPGTVPLRHRLRAVGVLGLRRGDASWLTGTGPIYNLAFVRAEEPTANSGMLPSAEQVAVTGRGHATGGEWQDVHQADVLTGHRRAADAVAELDLDLMRRKGTRLPRPLTPGYHTMLYRSRVRLPGGIVDGTAAGGLWAGPYQPYLIQVPDRPEPTPPVLLYLHGGGGNHLDNGVFAPEGGLRLGGALGVFPFGRETTTAQDHGYQSVSEQDVLDVLTDVRRRLRTDPDRTVVVGVSTGGGGALRLAQLHPDLFSGVLAISAYDDTHVPENLLDLPVLLHNGGADPAVSPPVVLLTQRELDGLGDVGYRSYTVAAHSHADPTAPVSQCLITSLLRGTVQRDPARVVLALDPANDPAGLPDGVHLQHDRAYWVGGVTVRAGALASAYHTPAGNPPGYGDNAVARVDVTSHGLARRTARAVTVEGVGQNVVAGSTLCGPDNSARTDDVWRVHGVDLVPGDPQPVENAAEVSLRQVSAVSLDLARMRLSSKSPVTLRVVGDGRTDLTLRGRWPDSVRVAVDGRARPDAHPRGERLTVTADLSGSHTLRIG